MVEPTEPKVTKLPARAARGAFKAASWAANRSSANTKASTQKAELRKTKLLSGGRRKK